MLRIGRSNAGYALLVYFYFTTNNNIRFWVCVCACVCDVRHVDVNTLYVHACPCVLCMRNILRVYVRVYALHAHALRVYALYVHAHVYALQVYVMNVHVHSACACVSVCVVVFVTYRLPLLDVSSCLAAAYDGWSGGVYGGEGGGVLNRRNVLDPMHGRSRMTIDPRIPMPGRSMSGFHRPGRHCLRQARSAVRCLASRMKSELHPSKNRF